MRRGVHLAAEADPGVPPALEHHPGHEGLVVAHVDAGQVPPLGGAGLLGPLPGLRPLHHAVAVQLPGHVALPARALRGGRGGDTARWRDGYRGAGGGGGGEQEEREADEGRKNQ